MTSSIDDRWRRPCAALIALVSVLGCAARERGPTEVRFLDPVAGRGFAAGGRVVRAREVLVADETWLALPLTSRQRATTTLELGEQPVLTLGGCLQCDAGPNTGLGGVLLGGVQTNGGRGFDFNIPIDTADGWWLHQVDLGRKARRRVQLWLEAELPEGCSLLLRAATVRQRIPIPPPTGTTPTQILLISVDTLRSDAVAALGGTTTTPHLDSFAAGAESWTRHYAAASWTKPSHASLLTGFYPDTHRAITMEQAMDPAIPTLAGRFRDAGFQTAALVFDCTWLSPRWGFSKGFDSYQVSRWRAERQARMAAEWVLDHRSDDFFFFLHTFEPHSDFSLLPYEAPGLNQLAIAERFGVVGFGCRSGRCASQFVNGLRTSDVPREPQDARILRYSYDQGVHYLDGALGELFEALRSGGVWDRLLIVVTSDHGEAFGEHGEFGHDSLHEEIVRVPLLIKWPGGEHAGKVHPEPRSAVDVAPTLLGVAGLVADSLPGEDLRGQRTKTAVFSGTLARAVIVGDDKGIFGAGSPEQLFDLQNDRGEESDLANVDPARTRALRELLVEHRQQSLELYRSFGPRREGAEVVLSERERERLRAFGYLN
jgi:choline-sulfatase